MGVSTLEKIFFAEHLSLMLKSGVSIIEALDTLKEEVKSKTLKKAIGKIRDDISSGRSLSESLKRYPKIFDNFFCSVVKIGEKTGKLDENLKFLAQKLNQENELKRKLRGAMIYPAILVFVATLVILLVIFFLLPRIVPLFSIMKIQLPLPTRILIKAPSFFRQYGILILISLFSFFLSVKFLRKFKIFRFYFDKILLSLPFLGNFLKNLNLAHFSRSFFILFKSGLSLREILELCSETLQNEIYKESMIFLTSQIERGKRIGEALKKLKKYFPLFFCQMVLTGERTGNLEESFFYLSQFYNERVSSDLKRFSTIIEPALIVFVGIFVGFIAFSVITPIYKFLGQFRFR